MRDLKQFITNKEMLLKDDTEQFNIEAYLNKYDGLEWFKWLAFLAFYSFNKVSDVSKLVRGVEKEEVIPILSFSNGENLHIDDYFKVEGFFPKLIFSSLFKKYSLYTYDEYIPLDPCDEEINFEEVLEDIKKFLKKHNVIQQDIDTAIDFFKGGLIDGCSYYVAIIETKELALYYKDQALNKQFQEAIPGYFLSPNKYIIYSWCSEESSFELDHVNPKELLKLLKMYIDEFGDSGRIKDTENARKLLYAQKVYANQTEYITYIDQLLDKVMNTFCTKTEVMF